VLAATLIAVPGSLGTVVARDRNCVGFAACPAQAGRGEVLYTDPASRC
jgi:hypothetical protein